MKKQRENTKKKIPTKNDKEKKRDIYWYAALAGIISTIIATLSFFSPSRDDPSISINAGTSVVDGAADAGKEYVKEEKIQMSQNGYVDAVETESGCKVLFYDYNDYDDNGKTEMFAVVDTDHQYTSDDYHEIYWGDLWFVDKNGAIKLTKEPREYCGNPLTIMLERRQFFVLDAYYATGSCIYLWGVLDEEPFEFAISGQANGLSVNEYNEVEITGEDYSLRYDKSWDEWTGHTYITYYLYFDGRGFKEYGGMIISWEEMCRCSALANIISKIEEEKLSNGWLVDSIFYRENGVFNINLRYETDKVIDYEYKTIRVWKGSVIEYTEFGEEYGEGFCKKACLENIATYPDTYPY